MWAVVLREPRSAQRPLERLADVGLIEGRSDLRSEHPKRGFAALCQRLFLSLSAQALQQIADAAAHVHRSCVARLRGVHVSQIGDSALYAKLPSLEIEVCPLKPER